jgi:hypothetical protein
MYPHIFYLFHAAECAMNKMCTQIWGLQAQSMHRCKNYKVRFIIGIRIYEGGKSRIMAAGMMFFFQKYRRKTHRRENKFERI